MLRRIEIENFLTIEKCTIEPSKGLTAIVGESGSGKSLILKAIDSVFSSKVDTGVVGNFGDKTTIKLFFELNEDQKIGLEAFDIDADEIVLIRIIKKGKSRILLNHEPITSKVAAAIKELLLGVVSYDYRVDAFSSKSLLEVIDSLIDSEAKESFREAFLEFLGLSDKLKAIENRLDEIDNMHPEVLLDAIEKVNPRPGEYEELLDLSKRIKSISLAKEHALRILNDVYDAENSVVDVLQRSVDMLEKLKFSGFELDAYELFFEAVEKLNIARGEFEQILDKSYQDEDIDKIQARLFELEELQRKFSRTLDKIIEHAEKLKELIKEKERLVFELEDTRKRMDEAKKQAIDKAEVLSSKRKEKAEKLKGEIVKYLKELMLDKTVVFINFDRVGMSKDGFDSVSIAFSANPDLKPAPIDKVASGGERSRFILSLKRAIADIRSTAQTLLLDEIETGVSGKTLKAVLNLIKDYSDKNQVIMITHSDEAKSIADRIYRVKKVFDSSKTRSIVSEE
ncbi:AAA family ATPase [Hippea maritima]|uniref:DNA repair protein RecN n=1 Tax=Hippea maritima (strain ATCC 700847 / DSM 10411 / MH2) TaxID=760142 RepID=F2LW37_HIPMA|nr:AAA family ATPase [Hippea maritima]AEA33971.1 SMC domain protein [Hippea maritima DSM 10411]